jgi:hypothetical protein
MRQGGSNSNGYGIAYLGTLNFRGSQLSRASVIEMVLSLVNSFVFRDRVGRGWLIVN